MKVSISVPGRFHAFELAKQLESQGHLQCLVTSYPKFEVKKYGIPTRKVKSIVCKEIITRLYKWFFRKQPDSIWINHLYDWIASYKLPKNSDIYVLWAGFAEISIKRLKKVNPKAKFILERGSTHIQFQREILELVYKRELDMKPILPSYDVIIKERIEYELADFIAIPTTFVEKTFLSYKIPKSKLFVNPYGVDFKLFKSYNENNRSKSIRILFVGNFSIQKGASIFIDIIEQFTLSEKVKFSIVGNVESGILPKLNKYIETGKVIYHQHVPQNSLPEYYGNADLFLFPSYQEGLALVLLQAMSSGLAVLATENSGAKMLIEHEINGIIINHNVIDICREILSLLNNKNKLVQIQKNATQSIQNGFSWNDYQRRTIGFYTKILK